MLKFFHLCPLVTFSRLLYPFDILHCFVVGGGWFILLKLLFFGTTRYCRLILYIFSLSPRISPFSQEPWLLLFERVVLKTKIWVVGALIAPGCHLVFSLVWKSFATSHSPASPWMWTTIIYLSHLWEIPSDKLDTILYAVHTLILSFNPQNSPVR